MKTLLEEKDMAGKIQMIYIDPPFFTKTDYDAVMKAGDTNIRHKPTATSGKTVFPSI